MLPVSVIIYNSLWLLSNGWRCVGLMQLVQRIPEAGLNYQRVPPGPAAPTEPDRDTRDQDTRDHSTRDQEPGTRSRPRNPEEVHNQAMFIYNPAEKNDSDYFDGLHRSNLFMYKTSTHV